ITMPGLMKIRIGIILGIDGDSDPGPFGEAVTAMEELGFDSLWLAELTSRATPDPIVGLTWAAARTSRLKIGPGVLVLPGRNPAVVAKQLASLDRLSGGRLLVAFGLGLPDPAERAAFPIPAGQTRGQAFDTALVLVRRYLGGEVVDGVRVRPDPVQQPFDLWVGGNAPAALVRAGRLADGWLPSLVTPEEAAAGRAVIEREAAAAGRRIDPEHFGVSLTYLDASLSNGKDSGKDSIPEVLLASIARRRPGLDPAVLVPSGLDGAVRRIEEFVAAGFSKFVIRPASRPPSTGGIVSPTATLEAMADALLPLQT
ncbi:MAG TPA: LLM class flavin-dependent oxidoreductase, partial [Acidimicrobiia bacterium]|nr:LLM class flavin-dependent oxidoreductase [Acidimicrobiia bacterium]